jgi:hypothetical protein
VSSSQHFIGSQSLQLQGQALQEEWPGKKVKYIIKVWVMNRVGGKAMGPQCTGRVVVSEV